MRTRIRLRGILAALAASCAVALTAPLAHAGGSGTDLEIRGSAKQVHVTGAESREQVELLRRGSAVASRRASKLGGVVFRDVKAGTGYSVRGEAGGTSRRVRVLSGRAAPRDAGIFEQDLPAGGYGYLKTRDGTSLAINVLLPGPAEDGPYPTLVEYSGYGYADPAGPESGIGPIAGLLGYAVVDVNMRGTGCSGGAFDYFERLQSLDGYDVIETVARQPWVMHNHVGMLGISYGGISQLFTAQTRPPSLAAITPLSVIDDTLTTLYPGGILNTGFAFEWAQDRVDDAEAAGPQSGQSWAWKRIQEGDSICEANQDLHPEAVDLIAKTRRNTYYRPKLVDPLSPITFVDRIEVPVFAACQWQDEQTGGHCAALADEFTGTDRKWFTFTNGTHSDSLDPATFVRWFDFLELYVAKRRPVLPPSVKAAASGLYSALMGVPGVGLPDDPIQDQPDYGSALAAFENQRPVRVLFENGAGAAPGAPVQAFERSFKSLPAPGTENRSWYLAAGEKLKDGPARRGAEQFRWAPGARPPTNFTGNTGSGEGGLWTGSPDYEWSQNVSGKALSYLTSRLDSDTAVVGAGELQLWVRSSADNVDLQATVSEVRPDGAETFVQGGWLRTSARKLDPDRSRLTEPRPSYRKRDEKTLPSGRWVKVRIPLYFQGHVYREDSKLRVTVSAPGGDQPIWAFAEAGPGGRPWVAVAHSKKLASRLVLPVKERVGGAGPPPPCPGLRGQPCRDYEPLENVEFAGRTTRWLCKPGLENNPCRTGLRTTLLSPGGEPVGEAAPKRSQPRKVDCFYVYPTVSDQDRTNANRRIDPELRSIALFQAARYGQHCRLFVPVYRQVTLKALNGGGFTEEALSKGYSDVRRAWRDYSNRKRGKGRGVVLIGHSQGTFMLQRLVAEEIDPRRSERRRLVAAILLGGNVTVEEGGDRGGSFERVPACRGEDQLSCVIAFSAFNGAVPDDAIFGRTAAPGEEVLCTNPAALGGGSGRLRSAYPTEPFAPGTTIGLGTGIVGLPTPEASTPWYETRNAYVGECSGAGGADVLQVSARRGAEELRAVPDATWGLHLADANIALASLVDLVGSKARRYVAEQG